MPPLTWVSHGAAWAGRRTGVLIGICVPDGAAIVPVFSITTGWTGSPRGGGHVFSSRGAACLTCCGERGREPKNGC